jgi:dTDP-4-dehydrorhamnose reductase
MRIFITGSTGQLGHELAEVLKQEDLLLSKRPEHDITDEKITTQIQDFRPDIVIHAAAYTDVDGCEKNRDLAHRVNAIGTHYVAMGAEKCGAKLIYLSTDYVFNGRNRKPYEETDDPHPINVYGQTKWEGEQFVEQSCPRHVIVRTSWVYGQIGKSFVKTILSKAAHEQELQVVKDQMGCPTNAKDLAVAIAGIIHKDVYGLFHAAGKGACSWYDFAAAIVSIAGRQTRVIPINSWEIDQPAKRPRNSVLSQDKLNRLGISLRDWEEALREYIGESV